MSDPLAWRLAYELADAMDGLSGDALARRIRRRRADVLAMLAADARFVRRGRTRGTRYRLLVAAPGSWERMPGPAGTHSGSPLTPDAKGAPTA